MRFQADMEPLKQTKGSLHDFEALLAFEDPCLPI